MDFEVSIQRVVPCEASSAQLTLEWLGAGVGLLMPLKVLPLVIYLLAERTF